jgi:DNA-binding XRE family transcriptional regulator
MSGPQTAASKRLCSEHVYEYHRELVAANPTQYTALKRARYSVRLRQADLAAAAGICRQRLSLYEQGTIPKTEKVRVALANALGVRVKDIFK